MVLGRKYKTREYSHHRGLQAACLAMVGRSLGRRMMHSQALAHFAFCVHREGLIQKEFKDFFFLSAMPQSAFCDWEPFISFLGTRNSDDLMTVDLF